MNDTSGSQFVYESDPGTRAPGRRIMVGGFKTAVAADEIVRVFVANFGKDWAVWATVATHVSDQVEHNVRMTEALPDEEAAQDAMVELLGCGGFELVRPVEGLDGDPFEFRPAT